MSTHKRATAAANLRLHRALRSELDKQDTDRLNLPINIGIAVAFLGLGCVARMLLPWPATKFLVGIAVITLVVCTLAAYLRRQSHKTDAAETEADAAS